MDSNESFIELLKSLLKRTCFWSVVYSIGLHKLHMAWIILPLSISAIDKIFEYRRQLEQLSNATRKSDISSSPRWVYYPDTDRAEWVNQILKQLWPAMQNYATDLLTNTADQLNSSGSWLLKGFQFDRIELGKVPPRVGGVKVYHQAQGLGKEVIMDVEVTLATNCDISARVFPFVSFSVRDLYLHGTLRMRLKPLLENLPIVGGVSIAFTGYPSLDFDLGGFANIVDIPGVSRIVRNLIIDQIANFAVMPHFYHVQLALVEEAKGTHHVYEEIKVLRLCVRDAKNLLAGDFNLVGKNTSDPYVKVSFGEFEKKSEIIKKTLDPVWDFKCEFVLKEDQLKKAHGEQVQLEIWDFNKRTRDDFLGRINIACCDLIALSDGQHHAMKLEEVSTGEVSLQFTLCELISDMQLADKELGFCPAVLLIYLDSCRNLDRTKKGRAPSPRVHFSVGGKARLQSSVVTYTQNPVYEEEFHLFVANPDCDDLSIKIMDDKSESSVGLLRICLSDLIATKGHYYKCQPWRLNSSSELGSQIVMSLKLMFMKVSQPSL